MWGADSDGSRTRRRHHCVMMCESAFGQLCGISGKTPAAPSSVGGTLASGHSLVPVGQCSETRLHASRVLHSVYKFVVVTLNLFYGTASRLQILWACAQN